MGALAVTPESSPRRCWLSTMDTRYGCWLHTQRGPEWLSSYPAVRWITLPLPSRLTTILWHGLGLPPGYILSLGRLEPRKNISGLLHAYRLLLGRPGGCEAELVIAGERGWFYDPIFRLVSELGLDRRVHFLGRVPDEDLPAL